MKFCRQNKILRPNCLNKHIAIIGMGALGSNLIELLVRSGIKTYTIFDPDKIEEHNLHRQNFLPSQVGKPKVSAIKENMLKLNPNINIKILKIQLNQSNINTIKKTDIVVDCTDNLKTRFLINKFSKKFEIPWIFGSCVKQEGMISFFTGKKEDPCFNCYIKNSGLNESCEEEGILNSVANLIASLQAQYVYKFLMNKKIKQNLLKINLEEMSFEKFSIKQNNNCQVCQGNFRELTKEYVIEKCKLDGNLKALYKGKKKINLEKLAVKLLELEKELKQKKLSKELAKNLHEFKIEDSKNILILGVFNNDKFVIDKKGEIRLQKNNQNQAEFFADLVYSML